MSCASGMVAYSEAGPAWLENCELTQAMPVTRAFSIAISAARFMTRWPMPLSPFTSAVEACSRTTRMSGRTLKPPALMRRAYCGRQPAAAVSARPVLVGFRLWGGVRHGVLARKAEPLQRLANERPQPVEGDGR